MHKVFFCRQINPTKAVNISIRWQRAEEKNRNIIIPKANGFMVQCCGDHCQGRLSPFMDYAWNSYNKSFDMNILLNMCGLWANALICFPSSECNYSIELHLLQQNTTKTELRGFVLAFPNTTDKSTDYRLANSQLFCHWKMKNVFKSLQEISMERCAKANCVWL